jgi:hypothetical protein
MFDMMADKWRMDGGSGGKAWQICMKSNIVTEAALRPCPWLSHSANFVKNVGDRWRICRYINNISAMISGKGN